MNNLKLTNRGQSMLELVIGIGVVSIVVIALASVTFSGLRNTQFSKNQIQATKLSQENLEKVRTIKNTNFGVCLQGQATSACSRWEDIWTHPLFGSYPSCSTGCTFTVINNCTAAGEVRPICLVYSSSRGNFSDSNLSNFTYQIILEDESTGQKRVTSLVYWNDPSGEHSSNLVTVFARI